MAKYKKDTAPAEGDTVALALPRSEVVRSLESRIALGKELPALLKNEPESWEAYMRDCKKWMEYNEEFLRRAFTKETIAKKYHQVTFGSKLMVDSPGTFTVYRKNIDEQIVELESILERLDVYRESASLLSDQTNHKSPSNKIFLVHGHDEAATNEVALFLSTISLYPIILHRRPNGGRHLLTKFREESEGAGFA